MALRDTFWGRYWCHFPGRNKPVELPRSSRGARTTRASSRATSSSPTPSSAGRHASPGGASGGSTGPGQEVRLYQGVSCTKSHCLTWELGLAGANNVALRNFDFQCFVPQNLKTFCVHRAFQLHSISHSQVEVGLQLVPVAFVDAQLLAVHPVRQLGAGAAQPQPQPHAEWRVRRKRASPPLVRSLQATQQVAKL